MSCAEESAAGASAPPLHTSSFKLRFAEQRELGRSYVSALKPLRLPAVVADKFYRAEACGAPGGGGGGEGERRVADMFARGPRQLYHMPLTTSHQYGWWSERGGLACREDRRLHHHIRDSAWLKERLRVLSHHKH